MSPEQRIHGISRQKFLLDYQQNPQDYHRKAFFNQRTQSFDLALGEYLQTTTGQIVILHGERVYALPATMADRFIGNQQAQYQQFFAECDQAKLLAERTVGVSVPTTSSLAEQKWWDFYQGKGSCANNPWYLENILALDDAGIEQHHNFIRPLFPDVGTLSPSMMAKIQSDSVCFSNITRAMDRMLHHWGIERTGYNFVARRDLPERLSRWITRDNSNHNERRISRMLAFLHGCGCAEFAQGLCLFLQRERANYGMADNPHWSRAVGLPVIKPTASPMTKPSAPHMVAFPARADYRPRGPQVEYTVPLMAKDKTTVHHGKVHAGNYRQAAQALVRESQGCDWAPRLNDASKGSQQGIIRFYDSALSQTTHYLSNTYVHRNHGHILYIDIDGRRFASVEHYYQCMKFLACAKAGVTRQQIAQAVAAIQGAESGGEAKRVAGHYRQLVDGGKWRRGRDAIMKKAIYSKFLQIPQLRQRLCDSYPNILVEHTGDDNYWGNGGNDTGYNMTGQLLGLVRQYLLRQSTKPLSKS